jgi:hypothetical protein
MRYATLLLSGLLLCSHAALANRQPEPARMGNTDVVVDMPPESVDPGAESPAEQLPAVLYL